MRRVPIVIPVTIAACLSFSIPALAQQNDEGVQYNTIRTVLGAGRRELIGMVLKQGAFVTGIGVVIGLGGALLLTSFLEGLVFGITTPMTYRRSWWWWYCW